jgi:hypothetical protein
MLFRFGCPAFGRGLQFSFSLLPDKSENNKQIITTLAQQQPQQPVGGDFHFFFFFVSLSLRCLVNNYC